MLLTNQRLSGAILLVTLGFIVRPVAARAQADLPPVRAHHALAWDPVSRRVLLTGGSTPIDSGRNFVFYDDLWAFDGARWTRLPAVGARMSGVSLALDSDNRRILSFGGFDGETKGVLRVLEGNAWRILGDHPSMRAAESGFAFDTRRKRFIAYGGGAERGRAHGDTWVYDGARWERLDIPGPGTRQAHVMVYDERRARIVVFGGLGSSAGGSQPPTLGDTWEFDGERWIQIQVDGPSPRLGAGAAYDSRRGVVILFGGATPSGFAGDTWIYDGARWQKVADSGPDARVMGRLAYDEARDRTVLFGGRKGWPNGDLNDTWEWDGTTWTRK